MKFKLLPLLLIFFAIVGTRFLPSHKPAITLPTPKIIGGIVPHHLLVKDIIGNFFVNLKASNIDNIIVIGPNHLELGNSVITFEPAFRDQSMTALDPFIASTYPRSKIIHIVLKHAMSLAECQELAGQLVETPGNNLLIASIDFSHYLSSSQAEKNDAETYRRIQARDYANILKMNSDYLDSPAALVTALMYFDQRGASNMSLLDNENSGRRGNPFAPTTSYFSMIFYAQN